MKKINEIFYSLQGEGRYTGRPAVFVRFAGCNVKCPFCDTNHQAKMELSNLQIVEEVCLYPANFVVFTGGEPSLQLDFELVDMLQKRGKYVAVETNGTGLLPKNVDWVTLSPKFEFAKGAELVLDRCDELKVVYTGANDMERYDSITAFFRYLQPCADGDGLVDTNMQEAVKYCMAHPEWSLSLQTQKILNIL